LILLDGLNHGMELSQSNLLRQRIAQY